ncbi:MAG TPA: cadmium-translocating P-type ATPase [Candidatus Fraserbacteria bacterium]|nr:cadmium-translocating P-type ATPase [Candidatus Fraserbacteria bacterium]
MKGERTPELAVNDPRCASCAPDLAVKDERQSVWKGREALFTGIAGLLLAVGLLLSLSGFDPTVTVIFGRSIAASAFWYLAAILFGAYHFARKGLEAVRTLSLNINFLMIIAIGGAVAIGEYVEAASLAFLFSLAELLEEYSVDRARNSLRELMKLAPNQARVLRDGREETLPVEEIQIGDLIAVRPGERIAMDGLIIRGRSSVDQAPITGESMPVDKEEGDGVYAGSINQEGYVEVEVTKRVQDTTLAKIVHLVEEAEAQKAPSERFVETFGRYYTPTVVAVAVGVALLPPLLFAAPFNPWFLRAITLLVIACPCALLISTPVSVVSAITSAARGGVLIKGGKYLEAMGQVKAIAFDKTGTLTSGRPEVTDVMPLGGHSDEELLMLAASLERPSGHPIAQAILSRAAEQRIDSKTAEGFESITGRGVRAQIDGAVCLLGSPELFEEFSIEIPREELARLQGEGKTTMLVGSERELWGIVAVADRLRPEAQQAIAQLKSMGLEIIMITGDNEGTARAIAGELGITHFHASLMPDQKVHEIQHLLEEYGSIAMVGDGVNDAPALAVATVGIAMGAAGTDTALETADIALMADDLSKLPYVTYLSRMARGVIRQNIWSAIAVKLTLGLGVFPGWVTLVIAVLVGDMGMSLTVTGNAMRLARVSPKETEAKIDKGAIRSGKTQEQAGS